MNWLSRIFVIFAIGLTTFFFVKYGQNKTVFNSDSLGYYSYLPAFFCLDNFDSISRLPQDGTVSGDVRVQLEHYAKLRVKSEKGFIIYPYTYGVAFFGLPFFGLAELYQLVYGLPSSGYSETHNIFMKVSNMFYVLLGLIFTFIFLRKFYDIYIALFTVCAVLLASNLFWFTSLQFGMSHPILFFLVAFLVNHTLLFYKKPTLLNTIIVFLVLGFITLIRPTDILFALIPLLYRITTWESIKEKWIFIKKHFKKLLISVPFFLLPLLPQMFYWKKYAGTYLFNHYGEEGFDFLHPNLLLGLFGPDNGWLLYSPIWLLAVFILFSKKRLHGFKTVILVLLPIYLYMIYSWDCYQYINGFGSRPMLHFYALLAVPLAAFFNWAKNKNWTALIVTVLVAFFVYHNLHYSYLNVTKKYWSQFSNYEFYWNMMFKNDLSYNDLVLRDSKIQQPKVSGLVKTKELTNFNVKNDTVYHHEYDPTLGDSVIVIPEGKESPQIRVTAKLGKLDLGLNYYVKASCAAKFSRRNIDWYKALLLTHKFSNLEKNLSWDALNLCTKVGLPEDRDLALDSIWLYRELPLIWDTLSFYIPVKNQSDFLVSSLEFWNMPLMEFKIQYLRLELYHKE